MNITKLKGMCEGLPLRAGLYSDTRSGCIMELRNEISFLEGVWMDLPKNSKEAKENERLVEILEGLITSVK